MDSAATSPARPTRGGLFGKFLLPQIGIIALTSLIAIWWAGESRQRGAREDLSRVSSSQARLARDLNLPLDSELAGHFSKLSGYRVGLRAGDGGLRTSSAWEKDALSVAWSAINQPEKIAGGQEVEAIAFPIGKDGAMLVALQNRPSLATSGTRGLALWPVGVGGLLALGSAFAMARVVVGPLSRLSDQTLRNGSIDGTLLARRDELGQLARSLAQSREALREEEERRKSAERMALLGKMATSMAHEIKNPAAGILMQVRALEGTDHERVGGMIRDDAEEIVALVNQWLYVARPEPPSRSMVDAGELLERLVARMSEWARYHGCELLLVRDGNCHCEGDGSRLEQAFRNLIQNAVQAMPGGGTVKIAMENSDGQIALQVSDSGGGFSETALQCLGDAFYSEKEGGIGLGLALVKGIAEAHGGSFTAGNLPDGGARVVLTVPGKEVAR